MNQAAQELSLSSLIQRSSNDSFLIEPGSARNQQQWGHAPDQLMRSASRESLLSGTVSMNTLLSPMESQRSGRNFADTQNEQKLKYQMDSLVQALAEKERRNAEMDREIKSLYDEMGKAKRDHD